MILKARWSIDSKDLGGASEKEEIPWLSDSSTSGMLVKCNIHEDPQLSSDTAPIGLVIDIDPVASIANVLLDGELRQISFIYESMLHKLQKSLYESIDKEMLTISENLEVKC